ncbi:MAG: hypothetical protein IKB51_01905 [Clostridia bacterium]|nr:hypothetical protein [Clostridia bacterium]
MLYNKNSSKELDKELFASPTSEYRGIPFWSWNCKLTSEMLEKQIEYLKEMGFGGFNMHPRDGLDNVYLSDEFMGLINDCVDKAKKENMFAMLYDEDRWPSGFAGGLVTKDPQYRARRLVFAPANKTKMAEQFKNKLVVEKPVLDVSNELGKNDAIKEGKPYFVAAFDILLDENGYLASYKKIKRNGRAKGEKWVAFCLTQALSDTFNGYCYVDTLSKTAIKRFIDVTHERYKEVVGDEFGKTVAAVFTDEPQFIFKKTFERPTDKKACELPWTPDLPTTYKRAYGSDLVEHIPELFWDLGDERVSVDRYRFHDHVCERFVDAFIAQYGKWCAKNNLPLTGHMVEERTLRSQTHAVGEAMRHYKHFDYPGIDMLCNDVELTTIKQAQSVVHQYGKKAMMSELYGVTNWDFDFRGHKFQGDWQAALGVTMRIPHLSWVSMKGDAKRDYPASINYQSPWYKEYKYIEDHFARVNTAMTRGKPDVSIGVIHPIESYWLHWGPGATTLAKRNQLDDNFQNLIKWLLFNQLDFDYISESLFPEACKKVENPIKVGKMKYDVIVVPALETIRSSTVERLAKFVSAGGRVVFMGDCPAYVDCGDNASVKSLYDMAEKVTFEKNAIVNALEANRKLEIRGQNGGLKDNYVYQLRTDGSAKWLFVANAIRESDIEPIIGRHVGKESRPADKLYFKIKGKYTPKLYDTVNGEIKDISYTVENGYTKFVLDAYLYDSFLFKLEKYTVKSLTVPTEVHETVSRIDRFEKVRYEREEPNVLLFDLAEWKWDNETEYQPLEEIRRLDKLVREKAGIPPKSIKQPWCLPPEVAEHTVTMRFTFNSEIQLKGAEFACEDMEVTDISLDGKKIEKKVTGYFTDESIEKTVLPDIAAGKHVIEITKPLASRTNIENCFLLGDFNVRLEGLRSTIVSSTKEIGFGSITSQGMPFYGGNVKYYIDIEVPEDDSALRIHANYYRGALISVAVDGQCVGKIAYNPYTVIAKGLKKGKHTVEFTLFGNRHNSFGVLHNCDGKWIWFGPDAWMVRDDAFCYEYQIKEMGILGSPVIEVIKTMSIYDAIEKVKAPISLRGDNPDAV